LVQEAVRQAVERAGLTKMAGCTIVLHSFATHLLERGQDDTKIYSQDLKRGQRGSTSPANLL